MKKTIYSLFTALIFITGCGHFSPSSNSAHISSSAGILAQYLSASDIRQASAAEDASLKGAVGEKYYWPNSNKNYVISVREAETNGRLCREYQHVFIHKNTPKTIYDSACQIGGKWGVTDPL